MKHVTKKILYVLVRIDEKNEVGYPVSDCSCGLLHPVNFEKTKKGFVQTGRKYSESTKTFGFDFSSEEEFNSEHMENWKDQCPSTMPAGWIGPDFNF